MCGFQKFADDRFLENLDDAYRKEREAHQEKKVFEYNSKKNGFTAVLPLFEKQKEVPNESAMR